MKKQLPIYELVLESEDSDTEVSSVALVANPAIQKNFIAFKDLREIKTGLKFIQQQRINKKTEKLKQLAARLQKLNK